MKKNRKIVIAVTGASGSVYAKVLFDKIVTLSEQYAELAVVFSDNARAIWMHELPGISYEKYPFRFFDKKDFSAPFASGSSSYDTMIICPCSMGILGRVATGVSDDLITRAADVMLKERRKLICVIREAPYSLIHINNMKTITEAGGVICPASPSFYFLPQTMEQAVSSVVERVISLSGLEMQSFRWGE